MRLFRLWLKCSLALANHMTRRVTGAVWTVYNLLLDASNKVSKRGGTFLKKSCWSPSTPPPHTPPQLHNPVLIAPTRDPVTKWPQVVNTVVQLEANDRCILLESCVPVKPEGANNMRQEHLAPRKSNHEHLSAHSRAQLTTFSLLL